QAARIERAPHLGALFVRQIRHDEARDTGTRCIVGQTIEPAREQRIEIAHEQNRRSGRAGRLAGEGLELGEDPFECDALLQRGTIRALNRCAVSHWVRERHADFDEVNRAGDSAQEITKRFALRKSCRDVGNERGLAAGVCLLYRFADRIACCHYGASLRRVRCSVGMSLSPRPERPTSTVAPGCARARRFAPASACDDSNARRMPSAAQHSATAASASSSLTVSYFTLPMPMSSACSRPTAG